MESEKRQEEVREEEQQVEREEESVANLEKEGAVVAKVVVEKSAGEEKEKHAYTLINIKDEHVCYPIFLSGVS